MAVHQYHYSLYPEYTKEYLMKGCGQSATEANEWLKRNSSYQNNFKNYFLDKINNKDHYFFILTKQQLEDPALGMAGATLKKYGMDRYKVYESEYVYNSNYPDEGPKLKVFIFHFPEGYSDPVKEQA